jgi:hypothetical protein
MSKLPDIKRMTAHNLIVVLDITLLLISPQERETFPNLRGELPKTSPIQPNDATHTVERQRGWEIYWTHKFEDDWILEMPVDGIATINSEPSEEEH